MDEPAYLQLERVQLAEDRFAQDLIAAEYNEEDEGMDGEDEVNPSIRQC